MREPTRRTVLGSVVSLTVVAGCSMVGSEQSKPGDSQPETPPPSSDLPAVSGDSVSYDGDVSLAESDLVGWTIEGSFTKALDISAAVLEGPEATVYVTDAREDSATVPESTVTSFETPGGANGLELTDGAGTILLEPAGQTTLSVSFDAESI